MEKWDLYTKYREKTEKTMTRGDVIPDEYYHLVVSVWIKNSKDEYLLSQRHPDKLFPLKWECTGGSVTSGETSLQGAVREVQEELGIKLSPNDGKLIQRMRRDAYNDFYDVWLFYSDISIDQLKLQTTEVVAAQWMKKEDIFHLYETQQLHPLLNNLEAVL
ncbi:TPA: NUDIX domain-containing protein [Enterococcus faecalis]|uniref:NUDIX hydrolase n=1 Tax=Enterococcus TaxID=1350 RepID=UPI0006699A80|nr:MULTISPECIES: NUDIX domain-containing protein [Enterococcus]MBD9867012.1 NUDIX domain-containing protein [Enterococcus faecalis]MDK7765384.1 NUDIX domain-containing protein [Enterococcus faecalis]MDN6561614.1 NUDIX domain-containing protein [Enterococcus sp.]MDN6776504.1 NUDIX domain-containing protein [Enterococcus sp.]MDV2517201.1 NUDIX domain-containing protein [Enterococcus faecalis]